MVSLAAAKKREQKGRVFRGLHEIGLMGVGKKKAPNLDEHDHFDAIWLDVNPSKSFQHSHANDQTLPFA